MERRISLRRAVESKERLSYPIDLQSLDKIFDLFWIHFVSLHLQYSKNLTHIENESERVKENTVWYYLIGLQCLSELFHLPSI
jgi:hypothetical protein